MSIARLAVAERIKPLEGAIVRRVTLGATTEAGEIITLQSDGKWDPSNGAGVQKTVAIAIQGGGDGNRVDAVFFGPVVCLDDATPGDLVYNTDTAGEPDHTGGTKKTVVGWAESASVLFVSPQIVNFS